MAARLLIVDDEAVVRTVLAAHFRGKGYGVEVAQDGEEALAMLNRAAFDIVITDLMMPRMDGFTLLDRLRDQHPLIRAIVITSAVNLDNLLACLRDGAFTFVAKPFGDLGPLDDAVHIAAWVSQTWTDQITAQQRLQRRA